MSTNTPAAPAAPVNLGGQNNRSKEIGRRRAHEEKLADITVAFEDAIDLLRALDPLSSARIRRGSRPNPPISPAPSIDQRLWASADGDATDWVFRGQAKASWDLTPAAHRADAAVLKAAGEAPTQASLRAAEWASLSGVLQAAEGFSPAHNALALLNRASAKAAEPAKGKKKGEDGGWSPASAAFPDPELRDLLVNAAHNGVPTRALTWTSSALVAAWFAAAESVRTNQGKLPEDLSIWAVRRKRNGGPGLFEAAGLEEALAPRAGGAGFAPGLRASYATIPAGAGADLIAAAELDQSSALLKAARAGGHPWWSARRFTLPAKAAGSLLDLLGELGVNAATVLPGWQGVAASVALASR
ncbi:MAG: FRG domain-containing protein [Deltaproteobacteria bacterium]|nr:FRG domain-containing protein [Deltaproteobacteria bacterium]